MTDAEQREAARQFANKWKAGNELVGLMRKNYDQLLRTMTFLIVKNMNDLVIYSKITDIFV